MIGRQWFWCLNCKSIITDRELLSDHIDAGHVVRDIYYFDGFP